MTQQYLDDVLQEGGPTEEQRKKRAVEIKTWFGQFVALIGQTRPDKVRDINWIDNAENVINSDYWDLMFERVKPRIKNHTGSKRADRHKIASLMELLINWHQPITLPDPAQQEKINAQLAYFCALNIIGNWKRINIPLLHASDSFAREHIAMLESMAKTGGEVLPIFSNAASWYLVETIFLGRKNQQIM